LVLAADPVKVRPLARTGIRAASEQTGISSACDADRPPVGPIVPQSFTTGRPDEHFGGLRRLT